MICSNKYIMLLLIATNGCTSQVNLTDRPEYWGGGYTLNSVYIVTINVFLVDYGSGQGGLSLHPPGPSPLHIHPNTIDDYVSAPDSWPDVKSIIAASTRIRVSGFSMSRHSIGLVIVRAIVLDGAYKGHEVSINRLSNYQYGPDARGTMEPDPQYLTISD